MKKALLSLILAFVCLPTVFAQVSANRVFVTLDTATCTPFTWVDSVTYSNDTTVTYTNGDTTFVLVYRYGGLLNLYSRVTKEVFGECSATFNNKTYTQSTSSARDTIRPEIGCDSIVKVKVVLAKTDSVLTRTVCGGFTAPWGTTYTESVTILDTNITSATDPTCNYNYSLTLTVNPQYLDQQIQIADGGCAYIWNHGTKIDTIIDLLAHRDTLKTVKNCDSLVTLTVNTFSGHRFDTTFQASCNYYKPTWRDTIFVTGDYVRDVTTDSTGIYHADTNGHAQCVIHRILSLTIDNTLTDTSQVPVVDIAETGCFYLWGDSTITDTNKVHYQMFKTSAARCDSLSALRVLSYTGHEYDTVFATSCDTMYRWRPYTGAKYDTLYNATGLSFYDTTRMITRVDTTTHCNNHYVLKLQFYAKQSKSPKSVCDTIYRFPFYRYNQTKWERDTAVFTSNGNYTLSNDGDSLYTRTNKGCLTTNTFKLNLKTPVDYNRSDTVINIVACNKATIRFNGSLYPILESADTVFRSDPADRTFAECHDSVANLHIVINKSHVYLTDTHTCGTYYWPMDSNYYSESVNKSISLGLNADGCSDSARLKLVVNTTPIVTIEGEWALGVPNDGTLLRAISNETIKKYNWYINEALQSTHADSLRVPAVTENTDVRLEATNYKNCTAINWITITTNVGIDDVEGLQVNLYPNPTSRFLNLESAEGINEVVIYNTVGQQVITRSGNSNHLVLDLGSLSTGHYSLRIVGANGNSTTRSFIVNK